MKRSWMPDFETVYQRANARLTEIQTGDYNPRVETIRHSDTHTSYRVVREPRPTLAGVVSGALVSTWAVTGMRFGELRFRGPRNQAGRTSEAPGGEDGGEAR